MDNIEAHIKILLDTFVDQVGQVLGNQDEDTAAQYCADIQRKVSLGMTTLLTDIIDNESFDRTEHLDGERPAKAIKNADKAINRIT